MAKKTPRRLKRLKPAPAPLKLNEDETAVLLQYRDLRADKNFKEEFITQIERTIHYKDGSAVVIKLVKDANDL